MTTLSIANQTLTASEIMPALTRYRLIPQLLREMVIDRAIAPISCSPEEIAQACETLYQAWHLETETARQAWRSHYNLEQADFEQVATRPYKIEKFKQITWEKKLESYFLQRKAQLDRIVFSLIRLDNRGIANELFFRIQEGEQSFAELARRYAQGPEAQTNGLMGPVELGQLSPQLAEHLYDSPLSIVQPPTQLGEWYVITRVEEWLPVQLDEAMRERLLQENFELWVEAEMEQLRECDRVWFMA
jgi:parvulin-like peptidyl-prolyl isomerase